MNSNSGTTIVDTPILHPQLKDEWRITPPAIEREMERIAGLLQKTTQFESRTSTPHSTAARREACAALIAACQP